MDNLHMTDFRANLAETVNRVAYGGERVVVTKNGKPAAALVPVADLEALEDAIDIREALDTLKNDPETIPADEVYKKLGLV